MDGKARPSEPAYTTMATRSLGPSWFTSRRIAAFTSGSLFGSSIEPETSRRKTRLLGGRWPGGSSRPLMPIRTRRWPAFQGQVVVSMWTANGRPSLGGG